MKYWLIGTIAALSLLALAPGPAPNAAAQAATSAVR